MKELQEQYTQRVLRWQAEALLALQEAAEAYLVGLMEDAYVAPRCGSSCCVRAQWRGCVYVCVGVNGASMPVQ